MPDLESPFSERDRERLFGVSPTLVATLAILFRIMGMTGHRMCVAAHGGLRTIAQQQQLYAQGRDGRPGPIVTNADGIHTKSNHQAKDDGFGHAVDCMFVGEDPYGEQHPWQYYGATAEILGLKWGGRWEKPDRPHVELP